MSDEQLASTPDLNGLSADEAFDLLGNRIRLDIVRSLWSANAMRLYDDVDERDATLPYSELRRSVDVEDNGKFNYHLSRLRPQFVRRTDDGYRLSGVGKRIARTVVSVAGAGPEIREELDMSCPLCGGSVEGSYEDSWLRFTCTECDGLFGDAAPDGTLLNENFPPAGFSTRDVRAAYRTKLYRCILDMSYLMQGICRECASAVEASATVCERHDAGPDPCAECGRHSTAWAEVRCPTCRFGKRLPVELWTLGTLPMLCFLYANGIDLFDPSLERLLETVETRFDLTVLTDPLRFEVTAECGTETRSLVLDENLDVVES